MRLIRTILILILLLALFFIGLYFVASNAEVVTLDLLVGGWQLHLSLGAILLLTLVVGVVLGWLLHRLQYWFSRLASTDPS